MNEIKKASAATDAQRTIHINYSTTGIFHQKVMGKSVTSELKAFETIGKHLATFVDETDILDERSLDYIHGQGEGMLKVVDGMKEIIQKIIDRNVEVHI